MARIYSRYMDIEQQGISFRDGHLCARLSVTVKWWAWPLITWQMIRQGRIEANFKGWLMLLYKFPSIWLRLATGKELNR